jgi:hypothetical protein
MTADRPHGGGHLVAGIEDHVGEFALAAGAAGGAPHQVVRARRAHGDAHAHLTGVGDHAAHAIGEAGGGVGEVPGETAGGDPRSRAQVGAVASQGLKIVTGAGQRSEEPSLEPEGHCDRRDGGGHGSEHRRKRSGAGQHDGPGHEREQAETGAQQVAFGPCSDSGRACWLGFHGFPLIGVRTGQRHASGRWPLRMVTAPESAA